MLEVQDLYVEVSGKEIIKGVSLTVKKGEVHALMGPNGSGKSTLANALMGHPKYKITRGKIILDGKEITAAKPDQRAKAGIFLSFQYPAEIAGVRINQFLRTAVNELKGTNYSVVDFQKILKEKMDVLKMNSSFTKRGLNEGFSGGEKKRSEILQLLLLEPKYALLDETDSGLDVDAIKTVAESLQKVQAEMGILLITHYERFLDFLNPDRVSIMHDGRIVAEGDAGLAATIQREGFGGIVHGNTG